VTADPDHHTARLSRPWDLIAVAAFTILAGIAEIVTGFSRTFFGITTSGVWQFTIAAIAIGLSYLASGVLMLTMKRWAATVAFALLSIDVVGRIVLVLTGLYPTDTAKNTLSFIAGNTHRGSRGLVCPIEAEILRLTAGCLSAALRSAMCFADVRCELEGREGD
jgi:hypothetical protein